MENLDMSKDFKVFYRLAIMDEKKLLGNDKVKPLYDGLVVSSHLAAFFSNLKEYLSILGKPFVLDPVTYPFCFRQAAIRDTDLKVKLSFKMLFHAYGPIAERIGGKRNLVEDDIPALVKDDFIQRVLQFQREYVPPVSSEQSDLRRYEKYLEDEGGEVSPAPERKHVKPLFLVPPYLYSENVEDWRYKASLGFAKESLNLVSDDETLCPVLLLSKSATVDSEIKQIATDYSDFSHVFLWVNDLYEPRADVEEISRMRSAIQVLRAAGPNVFQLYGSYLSLCYSKVGLGGLCSGIGISESRDISYTPTGGGQRRYYMDLVHTMVPMTDALKFLISHPEYACSCERCRGYTAKRGSDYPGSYSDGLIALLRDSPMNILREHFLRSRRLELERVRQESLPQIASELDQKREKAKGLDLAGIWSIPFSHLKVWTNVLRES